MAGSIAVPGVDILLVSLGSTAGLRASDEELAASMRRGGASVTVAAAPEQRQVRTLALTDLRWARAAAAAARVAIAREEPRAIVYSTTTAAMFWPRPGAIRFDAPACATRPGRHGIWQRPLERRRLREATLLVPTAPGTLDETPEPEVDALVVPIPVEPSGLGEPWAMRDVAAVTYAADPEKKGLERVLAAWSMARRDDELLVVAGLAPERLPARPPGVLVAGPMDRDAYRSLLRRARVFVTAPRREDHGIAQLEALADGCVLVTTVAPGPYVALPIARALDPRLVGEDLVRAMRTALDDPAPRYTARSIELLAPYMRAAVDRIVKAKLLPRLLR